MMLLPERITAADYLDVVDAAATGDLITGPWNEDFQASLDTLAADPTPANRDAALKSLGSWATEWNSSLPD